jgi:hypothetical protein
MTEIAEHGEPTDAPGSARPNYLGLTIDERYQVLKPLGSGGMGTVVLARHTGLKRLVAIKFLERAQVQESGATQRLFREAQAAASIGHPNIVGILDVGVAPWGDPYLVMEYLEGEDLATFTDREGQISVAEACLVLEAVLNGLTAAHELGIVHRDLKPQNIFLDGARAHAAHAIGRVGGHAIVHVAGASQRRRRRRTQRHLLDRRPVSPTPERQESVLGRQLSLAATPHRDGRTQFG